MAASSAKAPAWTLDPVPAAVAVAAVAVVVAALETVDSEVASSARDLIDPLRNAGLLPRR